MADSIFDVVVAGTGVAGALIAYTLSRAGVRVALVDAGDRAHFDPSTGRDDRGAFLRDFSPPR